VPGFRTGPFWYALRPWLAADFLPYRCDPLQSTWPGAHRPTRYTLHQRGGHRRRCASAFRAHREHPGARRAHLHSDACTQPYPDAHPDTGTCSGRVPTLAPDDSGALRGCQSCRVRAPQTCTCGALTKRAIRRSKPVESLALLWSSWILSPRRAGPTDGGEYQIRTQV